MAATRQSRTHPSIWRRCVDEGGRPEAHATASECQGTSHDATCSSSNPRRMMIAIDELPGGGVTCVQAVIRRLARIPVKRHSACEPMSWLVMGFACLDWRRWAANKPYQALLVGNQQGRHPLLPDCGLPPAECEVRSRAAGSSSAVIAHEGDISELSHWRRDPHRMPGTRLTSMAGYARIHEVRLCT